MLRLHDLMHTARNALDASARPSFYGCMPSVGQFGLKTEGLSKLKDCHYAVNIRRSPEGFWRAAPSADLSRLLGRLFRKSKHDIGIRRLDVAQNDR